MVGSDTGSGAIRTRLVPLFFCFLGGDDEVASAGEDLERLLSGSSLCTSDLRFFFFSVVGSSFVVDSGRSDVV